MSETFMSFKAGDVLSSLPNLNNKNIDSVFLLLIFSPYPPLSYFSYVSLCLRKKKKSETTERAFKVC